ncbi:MAG: RluA family pseudouridine synthase [Candidatus Kerfeldbacteria bacterium]|nr:RluA family pseudouridine synthase [Candidatus Kerfeldbacteria bacterium]
MPRELTVEPDAAGERLDKYLVRHLGHLSRNQIQKLIEAGRVAVNGKTVPSHLALRTGDTITIIDSTLAERPTAQPRTLPAPTVLFENDSILVINKPAGLTVHPGAGVHGPTLIDWLVKRAPSVTTVGDDPQVRPGIVHRLDRDVSGVMVIAKTPESFENLKQQFKNRTVGKEYLALVHGVPKKRSDTINFRIDRSKRQHGRMAARPAHAEGREAVTHYVVERRVKNNALLRLTIATGRTHQIRVHLKALGHPIVGDTVYTTKPFRHKPVDLTRPFLHAAQLKFTDVDGTVRAFTAPLPENLRRFLSS